MLLLFNLETSYLQVRLLQEPIQLLGFFGAAWQRSDVYQQLHREERENTYPQFKKKRDLYKMNEHYYYKTNQCKPEMRVLKRRSEPALGNLSGTFEDTHEPENNIIKYYQSVIKLPIFLFQEPNFSYISQNLQTPLHKYIDVTLK